MYQLYQVSVYTLTRGGLLVTALSMAKHLMVHLYLQDFHQKSNFA